MKPVTILTVFCSLLALTLNAQNDTAYFMINSTVINKQSIKQSDVDSIKFYDIDTMSFVKNNIIIKKQSIDASNLDSIIFYQPTVDSTFTIKDIDGNVYKTVKIGNQIWMAENLKTTKYPNGTAIPFVAENSNWDTLVYTSSAYCWYNDDTTNKVTYGALYTWAAIMNNSASSYSNPSGVQGVCPTGWHLPSDDEWTQLTTYLGGESVAGDKLKEIGTAHWSGSNTGATNETGFTALPVSSRGPDGIFVSNGTSGDWWTCSSKPGGSWGRSIRYDAGTVVRGSIIRESGFSVRCVRD